MTYTARLEKRVRELEAELAAVRGDSPPVARKRSSQSPSPGPAGQISQSPPISLDRSRTEDEGQYQDTEEHCPNLKSVLSVKVNDSGDITYHGITSFFQLPNERQPDPTAPGTSSQQNIQRRERLIANAWQQRVLENYSDIPVSLPNSFPSRHVSDELVLGPFQISS